MEILSLHDKDQIEKILRKDPELNLYALGDLDDFFWSRTVWYHGQSSHGTDHLLLVYAGPSMPTVLAFCRPEGLDGMKEMLREATTYLPRRFYLHASPGLEPALGGSYRLLRRGDHQRMIWRDRERARDADSDGVTALDGSHADELARLYAESYPGNWFDPRMLDTGVYHGKRIDGSLVCAAGVHVYSRALGVAALGNITTAPGHRRQGHAKAVTAALLRALDADLVGLNVHSDNLGAIRMYESLGFETALPYREYVVNPGLPSTLS